MANEKISLYQTAPPTSFIVTFATELEKIDNKEILLFIESVVIGYNDINKKSS